jgi:hypothetical protein
MVQRLFVLVLLTKQFVFNLIDTRRSGAAAWLRRWGGKLGLMVDCDGSHLVLRGLTTLCQAPVPPPWAAIELFPPHFFAPG